MKIRHYILKETSNAKSELVLLEWTPRLCLLFVLYNMRLVSTFIIAMYGVMNNLLLVPNLIACYAKLHEMRNTEFHFALEVSFSIVCFHTAVFLRET